MKCVYCGNADSKVIDSRETGDNSIRRRRECLKCGKMVILPREKALKAITKKVESNTQDD